MTTFYNNSQPANILDAMLVMFFETVIFVKLVQLENAFYPILVILSVIMTVSNEPSPLHSASLIEVTLSPNIIFLIPYAPDIKLINGRENWLPAL